MNQMLVSLAETCTRYPLAEKVLVVSAYQDGYTACEALARLAGGVVNLRSETLHGLAGEVAAGYLAEHSLELLGGAQAAAVVEVVYRQLEADGSLEYFIRDGLAIGLLTALANSLLELRRYGISAATFREQSFVIPKKGRDLRLLLQCYQDYLTAHSQLDSPGLMSLALELLQSGRVQMLQRRYLLPDWIRLAPPEQELLQMLAGDDLIVLQGVPGRGYDACGMVAGSQLNELHTITRCEQQSEGELVPLVDDSDHPVGQRRCEVTARVCDVDLLAWLRDSGRAPQPVRDGSLTISQAYGLSNEVRDVLRRVLAAGTAVDQVTVAVASEAYLPALVTICSGVGVELTASGGMPVLLTGPGKVLQGLVEWIRSDYAVTILRELLQDRVMQLPDDAGEAVPPDLAGRLLRRSGIGWGRERYRLLLELENNSELNSAESVGTLTDQSPNQCLYQIIEGIFAALPDPDAAGMVSLCDYTSGLGEVLRRVVLVRDQLDVVAINSLTGALQECGQTVDFPLRVNEVLDRVTRMLEGCRVAAAGPEPGKLYVTGFCQLIWSDRPFTFVVGLDAGFPGSGRQDPVLLDRERQQLDAMLLLGGDFPRKRQQELERGLASRQGMVNLSFPSFDLVENRVLFPAAVLLQVHRLLEGDIALDYTDLLQDLGQSAGFCPSQGHPLDESEWWLAALAGGVPDDARVLVLECYKGLGRGDLAVVSRGSMSPTIYDGCLDLPVPSYDPRQSGQLVSCSSLELLAGCPFAYWLRYLLHLYPPQEQGYDPGQWLTPADRGKLFHTLYCEFLRSVTAAGRRVEASDRELMQQLADRLISFYQEQVPAPSAMVYESEVEEIRRSCELFLTLEEGEVGSTPLYFEVPFGLGEQSMAEAGLAQPVTVDLGDGRSLQLAGRIDRIDRLPDGSYAIWDYKTGSSYSYDASKPFQCGRHVQHALYAVAAEQLLAKLLPASRPQVSRSGYAFPTLRGEGERVVYSQDDRSGMTAVVNLLCDLLAAGTFVYTDNDENCRYCDYPAVCRQGMALGRGRLLRSNEADPRLEAWRRLKKYV